MTNKRLYHCEFLLTYDCYIGNP